MINYRLKNMAIGFILFLLMISHISLFAQVQKAKLFVSISPKTVIVGQAVNVKVSVVVPTWLLGAPDFPHIEIPGAISILPEERAENVTQTIDGETWSGISRTYLIYPQEEKEYKLPNANVEIIYSLGGIKKSPKTNVPLPQYKFNAVIPEEAKSMDYFLATSQLKVNQKIDRKLTELKVGDSFSRTITVDVKNTMAMFIPPIQFDSLEGLTIYHKPAEVKNKSANRIGFTGGYRIDKVSYFIQNPGDYELPEIEIKWWNLNRNRISISKIKAVKFHADSNKNYISEIAIPEDTLATTPVSNTESNYPSKYLVGVFLFLLVLFFIDRKYSISKNFFLRITRDIKKRKEAKENSEEAYYNKFKSACIGKDFSLVKVSFSNWLSRISENGENYSFKKLAEITNNVELNKYIEQLDEILFGKSSTDKSSKICDCKELLKVVSESRDKLLRIKKDSRKKDVIPSLNPRKQSVYK